MALTRRSKVALVLLGAVLLVATPVLAETLLASFFPGSGQVHYETNEGLEIVVDGSYQLQSGNPFTNESLNVSTESSGYVNVSASGAGNVTIDRISGAWTNASAIDATSAITLAPGDKQWIEVSHDIDLVHFQSVTADDGSVDLAYTAGSQATINVSGLTSGTAYGAVDVDSGTLLATDTADGSGLASFSGLASGSHDVAIEVGSAPIVDNGSAGPTGDLSDLNTELSIDIADGDFPDGDQVTVEFYADGSQIDTQQITANETVSTTTSFSQGGDHTWHVETNDSYGLETRSQNFTVTVPETLFIRNVTDPDQLISGNIEITFFQGETVMNASTSNGQVNLTGLEATNDIIARVRAEGYHTRTTVIESIFEQNSIFMLNDSLPFFEKVFTLTDPTGEWPEDETVLFVERPVNLSSSLKWRTVGGDVFGPQGVVIDLQQEERYRLVIKNLETDDTAVLGKYEPVSAGEQVLQPSAATVNVSTNDTTTLGYDASRNDSTLIVEYNDPLNETQSLTFNIHEWGNESNVLLSNTTFSDLGSLNYAQPLTADEQNTSWVVNFYWTKDGGTTSYAQAVVGEGPRDLVPDALDSVWRTSIAVFVLFIVALTFSELNVGIGGVVTALVGGLLYYVGLLTALTSAPAVVLALAVAVLVHYSQRRGAPT